MAETERKLAVVTGASAGIGYELAKCCARSGFDLVIAADEGRIEDAAAELRDLGAEVVAVTADLAQDDGVMKLVDAARAEGRPVDALLANAGRGLGGAFLDQDWAEARRVIDTNITGTLCLIRQIGRDMRERGSGRILVTGSIAGCMPGTFQAVYNGTKAFLNSFSMALRHELKGSGVSVTCLMPGGTETEFFKRADSIGASKKDDAAFVAGQGFAAMMAGRTDVVTGWKNKLQSTAANLLPADVTAEQHRRMAAPGTASSTDGGGGNGRARLTAGAIIGGLAAVTAAATWYRLGRPQPQLLAGRTQKSRRGPPPRYDVSGWGRPG
jgi:short-subunit dehydrogenase